MLISELHPIASPRNWVEQIGEAELIGGWAEVVLDEDFIALLAPEPFQVFLTSYDAVLLFVQNRTGTSFEIHTCPLMKGHRKLPAHCGWRAVGRRAAA